VFINTLFPMSKNNKNNFRVNLDPLFKPQRLAFIGASNNKMKWGYIILGNILSGKFKGEICPVSLNADEVHGIKTYKTIADVPKPVDLAMVVTPAKTVPGVIAECAAAGVKSVIVVTGGFGETGEEGARLQAEIAEAASAAGLPVVGPNTMGIFSGAPSLYALMPPVRPASGHIAFVAQSGNLGTQLMGLGQARGIGFSKFASSGNEAVLACENYIEYFGKDPESKVVMAYIEGLARGREFIDAAMEVSGEKPLIVFKGGKSGAGVRAAKSHTGSLAGVEAIYDGVFRQVGAIQASTPDEMLDIARAMSELPLPSGNRAGIFTWGGGWGVVAADACESAGLVVPPLSPETIAAIDKLLPPFWSRNNPIDLVGTLDRTAHMKCLEALVADPAIDSVLALGIVGTAGVFKIYADTPDGVSEEFNIYVKVFEQADDLFEKHILDLIEKYGKPIIGVTMDSYYNFKKDGKRRPVVFNDPHRAAHVLARMTDYKRYLGSISDSPKDSCVYAASNGRDNGAPKADFLDAALAQGRDALSEHDSKRLLALYGVPTAREKLVLSRADAAEAAESIGFPVVLKACHHTLKHKTGLGLIELNVSDKAETEAAYDRIMGNVKGEIDGILVQEMVTGGRELLAGMARDATFGPCVIFGLGGIMAEALRDVVFRAAPLCERDLADMISELRAKDVIGDFRGSATADMAALGAALQAVGRIGLEHPGISEIDVNPLIIRPDGTIVAADALVTLGG
jgi:acetyltransferase